MTRPPTVYMCVCPIVTTSAQYTTKRVGNVESYDVQTKVHTYLPPYSCIYVTYNVCCRAAEFMLIAHWPLRLAISPQTRLLLASIRGKNSACSL